MSIRSKCSPVPTSNVDTSTVNMGDRAPFTVVSGVSMHRDTFGSDNAIEVFVGTSAPQGDSSEHPAQTILMMHDRNKTAIRTIRTLVHENGAPPRGLVLVFEGDSEAHTFADALMFAATTIRQQFENNCEARLDDTAKDDPQ